MNPSNPLIQEIQASLLGLVGEGIRLLPSILMALAILAITSYAAKAVRQVVAVAADRALQNRSLRSLAVQISYVSAWVVGIVTSCVVAFPGLGLGDIIGLLGLGSVAIGFAFQDIFKNFLAGILLLLQQPFRIGDQIVINSYEGTVEEIKIRATRIRTYDGEIVVMPNSLLFTNPVQVRTALPHRRTDLAISVDYNTPLPTAIETLLSALKNVKDVLEEPAPEIDVVSFGDSAVDLMARFWTTPQQVVVRRTSTQVMIALKQACDRANIVIPYPIRTVYHFDQTKYEDFMPRERSQIAAEPPLKGR